MSKINEFYSKVLSEPDAKKQLEEILHGTSLSEADDHMLEKIGLLAQRLGYEISVEEAKAYLNPSEAELDDDDLDAVAGGKNNEEVTTYICAVGGQAGWDEENFGDKADQVARPFRKE